MKLEFTLRQNLPMEFTHKLKTQSGYMTVADAELTALDVVAGKRSLLGELVAEYPDVSRPFYREGTKRVPAVNEQLYVFTFYAWRG